MKKACLFVVLVFLLVYTADAQRLKAVSYMNTIEREFKMIQENMWYYTSAASHKGAAGKLGAKRNELIKQIELSIQAISAMKPFENSTRFRDSAVAFLRLNYQVLQDDFAAIMELQNTTEKTFEQVEAYIQLQEAIDKKLAEAGRMMDKEQVIFGTAYGLSFTETKDRVTINQQIADSVYDYYNPIYLIFYKSYLDELNFVTSQTKQDTPNLDKYGSVLLQNAKTGLAQLATFHSFKGDSSLKTACLQMLKFYEAEVEQNYQELKEYYLQKQQFAAAKAKIDALPAEQRTSADVVAYNQAVANYNEATNKHNVADQYLNQTRNRLIANWNITAQAFKDRHVPKR